MAIQGKVECSFQTADAKQNNTVVKVVLEIVLTQTT